MQQLIDLLEEAEQTFQLLLPKLPHVQDDEKRKEILDLAIFGRANELLHTNELTFDEVKIYVNRLCGLLDGEPTTQEAFQWWHSTTEHDEMADV